MIFLSIELFAYLIQVEMHLSKRKIQNEKPQNIKGKALIRHSLSHFAVSSFDLSQLELHSMKKKFIIFSFKFKLKV